MGKHKILRSVHGDKVLEWRFCKDFFMKYIDVSMYCMSCLFNR